jgi:hypothetical protein
MGWENNGVFYQLNADSMTLNTIRVDLLKSPDSLYHVQVIRSSRGNNAQVARELAQQISFTVRQADSLLYLPYGFTVSRAQHFRNQQVLVAVAIPVGRRILVDKSVGSYRWFNMNLNRRHFRWIDNWGRKWKEEDWNDDAELESDWGATYHWDTNKEYVMTSDGLVRTDKKAGDEEENENRSFRKDKERGSEHGDPRDYRYHKRPDSIHHKTGKDTTLPKATGEIKATTMREATAIGEAAAMTKAMAMTQTKGNGATDERVNVEPPALLLTMLF